MKKMGMLYRVLLVLSLSASVAQASDIQKEIDAEASMAMAATRPKPVARGELIHIAPVGGITFAKFKGETAAGYSFTTSTGYEGGIGILIGRGNLQFETGVMYAERSSREEYRMGVTTWDLTYQNKYIELPVMARYNVLNNKDVRLYAKAGAVASLLQDSTGTMSNMQNYNMGMYPGIYPGIYNPYNPYYGVSGYNSNLINDNSTKSAFSSVDFRWALGIGGQVRITKTVAVLLEGDYQTSVNNVSNSQPNGYMGSTAMNLQMETYGIRAGVLISM